MFAWPPCGGSPSKPRTVSPEKSMQLMRDVTPGQIKDSAVCSQLESDERDSSLHSWALYANRWRRGVAGVR